MSDVLNSLVQKIESVFGKVDDAVKVAAVDALAIVGSQNLDAVKVAFIQSYLISKGQNPAVATAMATEIVSGLDSFTTQLASIVKS